MPKPGGSGGVPPGSRENTGICRSSSISSGNVGSGGKIMSLSSMSESVHSGLSCFLSEQALEQEERQQRSSQLAEFQRLREVRAAAQLKNLEDFLRMNHVSLRDSMSYATGMIYRWEEAIEHRYSSELIYTVLMCLVLFILSLYQSFCSISDSSMVHLCPCLPTLSVSFVLTM